MNFTQIKYERIDEVAWITLNRPNKLNAFTQVMMDEWRMLLEDLTNDKTCRVIVTKGEGRAWSAGVDLSVFQEIKIESCYKMYEDGLEIIRLHENCPQVTIAMVNGFCFTGAMEIMMTFDLIIAANEAKIGDTHAKWGIRPTWGMTQRLQHQVGLRKAKELSFTAQTISGIEAAKIGLVNSSYPVEKLKSAVDDLIEKIIPNSGLAIGSIKKLYQFGSENTLKEGIDYESKFEMNVTEKMNDLKNFKNKI
ncbi:MAG: enoyl-CoA hydratase/isomerase family protein [Pelagibacteraceae bacterium]|nr:enoyl-CoA hydratase/isomerase family protein [Pelagibacteraceae bacterium]